jgi:hypothetical protein
MSNEQYSYIEEEVSFRELASRFGIDNFDEEVIFDVSEHGYEIESYDLNTKEKVWKPITAFLVKEKVDKHYQLGSLKATSAHRILNKDNFIHLKDHPEAVLINEPMDVLDVMVEDTENYIAEGRVNHNTTPGGMAIPYHASIRLKLTGGSKLEDKHGNVIGINVAAQTIKNKVAQPFRKVEFVIEFGKGIVEGESMFDLLREHCDKNGEVSANGLLYLVEGSGAWKTLRVTNEKTGEVLHEKKFNKSQFQGMIEDKENGTHILNMLEHVMVLKTIPGFTLDTVESDE